MLTTFRWRAIFTTNYDTGLERAYKLNSSPLQNPIPIAVTADIRYTDTLIEELYQSWGGQRAASAEVPAFEILKNCKSLAERHF